MEKILSDSEKIRKAEEIYARRRGLEVGNIEEQNKDFNIYKALFKLLLLFNIILVVLCVQNKNYIFKEDFLSKFSIYSESINNKVNTFINYLKEEQNTKDIPNDTTDENINLNKVIENTAKSTNSDQKVEKSEEITKEQTIAEKIKSSYSFTKPVEGIVTSFFGDRQSKYQKVTGYHKGIDIGAVLGTKIISSIEGKVTQVSSEGDYRKSFKDRKWTNNYTICTLLENIRKRRRKN